MVEVIQSDMDALDIPKDIEMYEIPIAQPPPPPSSNDEVTVKTMADDDDDGIVTHVPMRKADPSFSTNLTPAGPAIVQASSSRSNDNSSSSSSSSISSSNVNSDSSISSSNGDSNMSSNSDRSSSIQMKISSNLMTTKVPMKAQIGSGSQDFAPPSRHEGKGGTRPRGCPCCDPDNIDNIIDNFMHGGAFL